MYNFKREPNKYINKQKKKCVISNLSLDEGAAGNSQTKIKETVSSQLFYHLFFAIYQIMSSTVVSLSWIVNFGWMVR